MTYVLLGSSSQEDRRNIYPDISEGKGKDQMGSWEGRRDKRGKEGGERKENRHEKQEMSCGLECSFCDKLISKYI